MKYPVCLHTDDGQSYGVTVPDLPGCFSAGDSFDDALEETVQAISAHLEILVEDDIEIPMPTNIENFRHLDEYKDGIWGFVDIDITPFLGMAQKINVTLPAYLLHKIESELKNNTKYKSRSHFLAESALKNLDHVVN